MGKVIRLTEADLTKIVKMVIKEQGEDRKLTMAVQKFLNDKNVMNAGLEVDGLTGPNSQTEKAIMKLQSMLGVYPTDGKWGEETEKALEKKKPTWYKIWDDNYRPGWFSF
jgi:peptidoglycan hydrolase-like protein with peptidoglycan-binding domain